MTTLEQRAIKYYKSIMAGRTRYEGQVPRHDEVLVALVDDLRSELIGVYWQIVDTEIDFDDDGDVGLVTIDVEQARRIRDLVAKLDAGKATETDHG